MEPDIVLVFAGADNRFPTEAPASLARSLCAAIDPRFPLSYHGEQMAKRIDFTPEKPYTGEQLSEIRRNFAMLSKPSLQQAYSEALERCRLDRRGRIPASIHIQVLVQAWKQLRKAG